MKRKYRCALVQLDKNTDFSGIQKATYFVTAQLILRYKNKVYAEMGVLWT